MTASVGMVEVRIPRSCRRPSGRGDNSAEAIGIDRAGRPDHFSNNLWFDIDAMNELLESRGGVLPLPLIRNAKTVDPTDPSTPAVIQAESAMGAAIELFPDATTVEVGRHRFVPVKTTDDLLVLRSDFYRLDDECVLHPARPTPPFVALGRAYKYIRDFEARFPDGAPSLAAADRLEVDGDWQFGEQVRIVGSARLGGGSGVVPSQTTLGEDLNEVFVN